MYAEKSECRTVVVRGNIGGGIKNWFTGSGVALNRKYGIWRIGVSDVDCMKKQNCDGQGGQTRQTRRRRRW